MLTKEQVLNLEIGDTLREELSYCYSVTVSRRSVSCWDVKVQYRSARVMKEWAAFSRPDAWKRVGQARARYGGKGTRK